MTAWLGKAARSVVTIAFPASASAADAISPCSLEKAGRRFKSCAASLMTAAALRAARTATAKEGSLISWYCRPQNGEQPLPAAADGSSQLDPDHHAGVLVLEV